MPVGLKLNNYLILAGYGYNDGSLNLDRIQFCNKRAHKNTKLYHDIK